MIAMLHPGEMGAVVGSCLTDAGHDVLWVSSGRSEASARRAASAGLAGVADLGAALQRVEVVLSVVPPGSAVEVAGEVVEHGFTGLFVDCNAIAPSTARSIERVVSSRGAAMVDGGIVGPPPTRGGITRLALSGSRAAEVAELFAGTALEPVVVGADVGTASAFKLAFAAWTKGTSALVLALDAFLDHHGLTEALHAEWDRRGMDVAARLEAAAGGSVPKAWRFEAEMREIETALDETGLPAGWFDAAAEVYGRLGEFKDRFDDLPSDDDVRAKLKEHP